MMYEKKYKIVCLIHSLGHKGGMQRVAVNLANNWANNGHTVEIWTLSGTNSFYTINNNIRVINLTGKKTAGDRNTQSNIFSGLSKIIRAILNLNKFLTQLRPDILLIHRGGVRDSFVGFQRFYMGRTIELLHMQFDQEPGSFPPLIELAQTIIFKFFQPKKNLVVLNHAVKQKALDNGWENIYQIPNAVPFRSNSKSTCQNPYLLAIARDDPKKGLDILIHAFAIVSNKHKNWRLKIVGEGITNSENNVNKLITGYGLDSYVILLEPVSNIQDHYLDSSIYVLSSYTEGMPMVLLEAMECGLPIISSDLDGIDDVISTDCSLKFKTGDSKQLAGQINILVENASLRIAMGKASSDHVAKFYPDRVNNSWLKLFGEINDRHENKTI